MKLETYELRDIRKSKEPLEEYLKIVHGSEYTGTDDNMTNDFEIWTEDLAYYEITGYADELIKKLLALIPE